MIEMVRYGIARRERVTDRRLSRSNDNARWYSTLAIAEIAAVVSATQGLDPTAARGTALLIATAALGLCVFVFVGSVFRGAAIGRALADADAIFQTRVDELVVDAGRTEQQFSPDDVSPLLATLRQSYSDRRWDTELLNAIGLILLLVGSIAAAAGLLFIAA